MKWLWIVAAAGCSSPLPTATKLADHVGIVQSLWVVGPTLYFRNSYSGAIYAVPTDGSMPAERRFDIGASSVVAFGEDKMYYATPSGAVLAQPLPDGAEQTLATSVPANAIALSSRGIVLFADRIRIVPYDGGAVLDVAPLPIDRDSIGVAADGTYAYWVVSGMGLRGANRQPLDGSPGVSVIANANTAIVAHDGMAYTTYHCDQDLPCGDVSVVDFETRDSRTITSAEPGALLADDAHVYWSASHHIVQASFDGGSQETVVQTDEKTGLSGFTTDATSIYFSTASSDVQAVWSAPKP